MGQSPYNTPETIRNATASHMALLFVLDASGSMSGPRIEALNEGMRKFKEAVCRDSQTKRILDVAIIRFSHDHEVLQNFMPVEEMIDIDLQTSGGTRYAPPIREAIRMVVDRTAFYKKKCEPYKPWIVFITDGMPEHDDPSDLSLVANEVKDLMARKKLSFRSLMVGDENSSALHKLSPIVLRLNTNTQGSEEVVDFDHFIDWAVKSMAHVSSSAPGGPAPQEVNLTGNISVDKDMSVFSGQ